MLSNASPQNNKGMPLNTPDSKVVFGRGNPDAEVVFIGESPAEGSHQIFLIDFLLFCTVCQE